MAVNKGHLHIAEILVKNGADVNYRNKVRALIPITVGCTRYNKHAACAGHSRHAYVVVFLVIDFH